MSHDTAASLLSQRAPLNHSAADSSQPHGSYQQMEHHFRTRCGFAAHGEHGGCPQFGATWDRFERFYQDSERKLIISHAYTGQGMGFMSLEALDFVRLAMVAQRSLFFNFPNTPYDWTLHFEADHGRWGAHHWSPTCVRRAHVDWELLADRNVSCVVIAYDVQWSTVWLKELPDKERNESLPTLTSRVCTACLMYATFRPIWAAPHWRWLNATIPSPPRKCLAVRTHYAEDPACFPDETPFLPEAVDRAYVEPGCTVWTRVGKRAKDGEVLNITEAVAELGSEPSLIVTDAPALQRFLIKAYHHTVAIPGTGIDPNSGMSWRRKFNASGQTVSSSNLAKVSLDFWLMGFCECIIILMPSKFYEAALARTAGLRPGCFG